MSFQKTLNRDVPLAVAGDFASTNPRASMLAGEQALRASVLNDTDNTTPVVVGYFAFADVDTGLVYGSFAADRRVGFVHRNNQAIVQIGEAASMIVPQGRETALFTTGDFYTVFGTDVDAGDKVYALNTDGSPKNVVGADATLATDTGYIVAKGGAAGELIKITVWG